MELVALHYNFLLKYSLFTVVTTLYEVRNGVLNGKFIYLDVYINSFEINY